MCNLYFSRFQFISVCVYKHNDEKPRAHMWTHISAAWSFPHAHWRKFCIYSQLFPQLMVTTLPRCSAQCHTQISTQNHKYSNSIVVIASCEQLRFQFWLYGAYARSRRDWYYCITKIKTAINLLSKNIYIPKRARSHNLRFTRRAWHLDKKYCVAAAAAATAALTSFVCAYIFAW